MLYAKHHNESANHYDEQSSEPESDAGPAQVHSRSTSEDPVLTKPSESTGNSQEVQFVGEVCLFLALHAVSIIVYTMYSFLRYVCSKLGTSPYNMLRTSTVHLLSGISFILQYSST